MKELCYTPPGRYRSGNEVQSALAFPIVSFSRNNNGLSGRTKPIESEFRFGISNYFCSDKNYNVANDLIGYPDSGTASIPTGGERN